MFLERFLISNLWNTGLICVMLCFKWLLRNRLSLKFQYHSWYVLLISLMLPFLPGRMWDGWRTSGSANLQTFAISNAAGNTVNGIAGEAGWLQDTTELIRSPEDNRLALIILAVWLLGGLALVWIYWRGSLRLRMIKEASEQPTGEIRACFDACRRRLRMEQHVELRQSEFLTVPVSFGWRRSYIVLPKDGSCDLSAAELEHIMLHELAHIRHGDLITNLVFCGIQALFWFNPLVWLALYQMRLDREAYCDWTVLNELSSEGDRIGYGQTLLRFAAGSNPRLHTANGFFQSKDQLKYRLEKVVEFRRETKWKCFFGRCFAGILALVSIGQVPVLALCEADAGESYQPADRLALVETDLDDLFGNTNGCAVVYDQNGDQYMVYHEESVTRRVPPCSTYKIYSALNALEQGIITPAENSIAWDSAHYEFEGWNRDQTLRSAMQESVNWYFQSLDQAAGAEQLGSFFEEIGYGNCDLGKDPDNYWNGSGLRISALEQVELLVKLYRNDFGFDEGNIAAVMEAMALNDLGLYGKTGTGRLDETNVAGWFIGFFEAPDNTYFFAVYLNSEAGADGALAYETAMKILSRLGITK